MAVEKEQILEKKVPIRSIELVPTLRDKGGKWVQYIKQLDNQFISLSYALTCGSHMCLKLKNFHTNPSKTKNQRFSKPFPWMLILYDEHKMNRKLMLLMYGSP